VLSWSFFITKNMKADLKDTQLTGALPVLYVFLARAGCTIDFVTPMALDRTGNFVPEGKGTTRGVKIIFTGPGGRPQTLYHFTADVALQQFLADPRIPSRSEPADPPGRFRNSFSLFRERRMGHSLPRTIHRPHQTLPEAWSARPEQGKFGGRPVAFAPQLWLSVAAQPLLAHRSDREMRIRSGGLKPPTKINGGL
jgi:hypothetical protein